MKNALHNCTIFNGETTLKGKALLTQDGLIHQVVSEADIPSGYTRHDLHGYHLAPAFIDLQIYGGSGKLFSLYPSVEALTGIYHYCRAGGTLHFQATVATNSLQIMTKAIEAAKAYRSLGLPGLIGVHLEGPYINSFRKGAHLEHFIHRPTREEIHHMLKQSDGIVTMMTVAPEMCSEETVKLLQDYGVILSAGHSNATYQEAMKAFDHGIGAATHLFNAMSPLQSREPGLVGAIYDHSRVRSSVVADGIHVDFNSIRISKKIMQERLFLITDAVEVNPVGDYVYIRANDRYVTDNGTLAGSLLTMMSAVKNCVKKIGISLEESLRMASLYPAIVAGKDLESGKLLPGYKADMVVFDDSFEIKEVITEQIC